MGQGLGGLGVDEEALVSALGKWRHQPEKRAQLRKSFAGFFTADGGFERFEDDYIHYLKIEFARFKNIMVLWAMHPWERDARWANDVLHKAHPFDIIVEIACTRSSEELLGARIAYHALFHRSLEEDVAYHVRENFSNLLVGLVSAYRYEGDSINEEMAKSEAKTLGTAIKSAGVRNLVENGEVIRILTTRSKPHLRVTFKYYREMYGKSIEEDLGDELCLQETVQCLDSPPKYFSKVMDETLKDGADKNTKDALTRVIVSRADVDMEEIKAAYHEQYGAQLEDVIAMKTLGNYRDALLSLVGQ
ncbi:annexin D4 isoform X2 [Elaeis guineensis]|uniref:Annexin D4 isoform X2 n=1 Tax=Elaeis guineensis var. tenera TaxID=51953 RepID=A0A6J0PR18_ELAGV|nr:annexin D4 isoform X2 [Elaeis guineensis]